MPSIGDLANDVAKVLYEQRIVVAGLAVVALVGLVLAARRFGWLSIARRHRVATTVTVVAALAVAVPLGWYLGSPLVIRTSLVEVLPSAVPLASPAVVPSTVPTPTAAAEGTVEATPRPTASPSAFLPRTVVVGSFQGTDDFHFGRGTASLIELQPGRYHLRLDDFSVRNGPDLYVYLSPLADDWTETALELGTLKATDGSFGYDLPAGTDPAAFRSALIWCKQFSHLFATATFEAVPA